MTTGAPACAECGFTEDDWEPRDRRRALREAGRRLGEITGGDAYPDQPLPGDLHGVQHRLWQVGRRVWAGTATLTGTVEQLAASGGGVPKAAVPQAFCGRRGLDGDLQTDREHHGAPWQALCLWSADVIEALQAEGHPIGFGYAGENVTVRGLDWSRVGCGQRWRLGPVLLETTGWAVPCRHNAPWFLDGDFRRMSQPLHPGWSRLYAWVLEPGPLAAGDPVVVEPGRMEA